MESDAQSTSVVFPLTCSFLCVNSLLISSALLAFKAHIEICFRLRIFPQGVLRCFLSCVRVPQGEVCKWPEITKKVKRHVSLPQWDLNIRTLGVQHKMEMSNNFWRIFSVCPKCTAGESSLSVVTAAIGYCFTWSQLIWLLKGIWNGGFFWKQWSLYWLEVLIFHLWLTFFFQHFFFLIPSCFKKMVQSSTRQHPLWLSAQHFVVYVASSFLKLNNPRPSVSAQIS